MPAPTDELRAATETLASAREHYRLADETLKEAMSEPTMAALVGARLGAKVALDEAERMVRTGIETAWAAAELEGDPLELPAGLGIQWRSEPAYDDTRVTEAIAGSVCIVLAGGSIPSGTIHEVDAALYAWLQEAIAKHRPALNRIILEYKPAFADVSARRFVATIPQDLRAKLNAEGGPTRQEVEAMVRKEQHKGSRELIEG